jgi:pSer/pThr/pTyr-binding forkhead associated (FHA) protein
MAARFFCKTGELAGSAYLINREATIGRLDENQIALPSSYISGRHARIYFDDAEGHYFLEDLHSSNGTQLDGAPVTEPTRLDRLHIITLSSQVDFIFHGLGKPSSPASGAPGRQTDIGDDTQERTRVGDIFTPLPPLRDLAADAPDEATRLRDPFADMTPDEDTQASGEKTFFRDAFSPMPPLPELPTLPDTPRDDTASFSPVPPSETPPGPEAATPSASGKPAPFVLVVTMPNQRVETFSLREGAQIIGRDLSCDLTIPDASVSRRHARLTVHAGTVTLEDLKSKNAIFIDGQRLQGAAALRPGSTIRFGLAIEARLKQA